MQVRGGRIAAIRAKAPRASRAISIRGAYLAPGFIDLHVWGPPSAVSVDAARHGTTAFLTTLGPAPASQLLREVAERTETSATSGAECLGTHLEGPFLNPARGGALPRRGMRAPTVREIERLWRASRGRANLITLAPELRGAREAIGWCRRHRIVVSLGHSEADVAQATHAVKSGARAVTHVFNGMRPLHHRSPGLVDVALTEPRLTAMVIADGVHVSAGALRLLVRAKGPAGIALVTDSVEHQQRTWRLHRQGGAYYTRGGVLAGSGLTMLRAVQQMVETAGVPLAEAVRMASEVPARLLGERRRGALAIGMRADLTAFRPDFTCVMTIVGGEVVYHRE